MTKLTRREILALAAAGAAAVSTDAHAGEEDYFAKTPEKLGDMPMRPLGKTGKNVSILTFGGFHLIEVLPPDAEKLLNFYLDNGGNFIETARGYGDSEVKIGRVIKTRRADCFLTSKTAQRTKKGAADEIDTSLRNLQTDHLDGIFMHNVQSQQDLDGILATDGALAAAEEAKKAGKVSFIAVTGHNPEMLYKALQSYPFDFMMEWMNYYDYFNFPTIYEKIIPYCREKEIGMMAMKPIGDGLLHRNPERALRWVWSLPIATAAAGNNSLEMLKNNIRLAKLFKPMSEAEKDRLYRTAPEYANYVCRRCGKCRENSLGLDPMAIFELEGYYDRQMYTGSVPDAGEYALRERLKHWFGQRDLACERYSKLEPKVPHELDPSAIAVECPYGIDIAKKLRLAAWKLTGDDGLLG